MRLLLLFSQSVAAAMMLLPSLPLLLSSASQCLSLSARCCAFGYFYAVSVYPGLLRDCALCCCCRDCCYCFCCSHYCYYLFC